MDIHAFTRLFPVILTKKRQVDLQVQNISRNWVERFLGETTESRSGRSISQAADVCCTAQSPSPEFNPGEWLAHLEAHGQRTSHCFIYFKSSWQAHLCSVKLFSAWSTLWSFFQLGQVETGAGGKAGVHRLPASHWLILKLLSYCSLLCCVVLCWLQSLNVR